MKKFSTILLLIFVALSAFSQNNPSHKQHGVSPRVRMEEFRQQVQNYITKEAQLTEQEAKVFFPIYTEYKDAQRKLHMQIIKLKKDAPTSGNEKEFQTQLLEMAKLNAEMAGLDSIYYKKIFKLIPAEKFYKILIIEDRVSRRILQNYNRGPEQKKGPNRR